MTPESLFLNQAHRTRLELINRPFPRIKAFDTHTTTARWAGCQIAGKGDPDGSATQRGRIDYTDL